MRHHVNGKPGELPPAALLIAIPCLNEATTIAKVIAELPKELPGISRIDVIVVDDGSTDATADAARAAGALVIRHSHNKGLGIAFQTAVSYAVRYAYDLMLNVDGDGQFSSADIPRLVEPIQRGEADMVTASRFKDKRRIPNMPAAKRVGNRMMSYLVSQLVGCEYHDVSCGYRCYSREALLNINLHGRFTYTQETFLDLSEKEFRIIEVPVEVAYFQGRKSRVASKLMRYAVQTSLIIFRSYRDYFPLKTFLSIGAIFAVPATVLALWFFAHFLATGQFAGQLYAGFASAFLFAIAAMFAVLAVVTDMLDRIRVNQERILYLLKQNSAKTPIMPPMPIELLSVPRKSA